MDASQGIQAQTISNLYLAIDNNLEIIPVINKIDMEGAMIPEVTDQIIDLIGCKQEDIPLASGKSGIGIEEILTAIIDRDTGTYRQYGSAFASPDLRQRIHSFSVAIVYFRLRRHIKEER
ncbi:MAG: GTP-binding protein [Ferruginibacter sp.]